MKSLLDNLYIIGNKKHIRQIKHNVLAISDIHIQNSSDKNLDKLIALVKELKPQSLLLLGDIFDGWIGWDIDAKLHDKIQKYFSELSKTCSIYFIAGNRDKLIYDLENVTILKDPSIVMIGKEKWFLTHGDRYCSQDKTHQLWLYIQTILGHLFMLLPRIWRIKIRDLIIKQSKKHKTSFALEKQQIPLCELEKIFKKHKVDMLLHGHTHMAGIKNHKNIKWVTLGDWEHAPSYLYITTDYFELFFAKKNKDGIHMYRQESA